MERQSSIEIEPRTLDCNQIELARKAALYVVNTRSMQEATTIFTEGLEPVERCAEGGGCKSVMDEEPDQQCWASQFRDIASAPF